MAGLPRRAVARPGSHGSHQQLRSSHCRTRVEQARALAAPARSQFVPQVNYGALAGRGRNVFPGGGPVPNVPTSSIFSGNVNASWEVDLWGRIRRLTESARAQFFASEEARRNATDLHHRRGRAGLFSIACPGPAARHCPGGHRFLRPEPQAIRRASAGRRGVQIGNVLRRGAARLRCRRHS